MEEGGDKKNEGVGKREEKENGLGQTTPPPSTLTQTYMCTQTHTYINTLCVQSQVVFIDIQLH